MSRFSDKFPSKEEREILALESHRRILDNNIKVLTEEVLAGAPKRDYVSVMALKRELRNISRERDKLTSEINWLKATKRK